MTEIKASDGKLYVSAIFDCYDLAVLGLAMDTNMIILVLYTNLNQKVRKMATIIDTVLFIIISGITFLQCGT